MNIFDGFPKAKLEFIIKYVSVDDKLSWKPHSCKVNEKINKCIGIQYKVRHTLNKLMRIKLYKTFVLPHLKYCNIVWASIIVSNLKKLEAGQRKAIKIALGVPRDTPTKTIFAKAKVLPLLSINEVQTCLFMFEYCKHKQPK